VVGDVVAIFGVVVGVVFVGGATVGGFTGTTGLVGARRFVGTMTGVIGVVLAGVVRDEVVAMVVVAGITCTDKLEEAVPPEPVHVSLRVMDGLPVNVILDEGNVNEPEVVGVVHTAGEFLIAGLLEHVVALVVDHDTVVD
jgi:hypothetical protein